MTTLEGALTFDSGIRIEAACLGLEHTIEVQGRQVVVAFPRAPGFLTSGFNLSSPAIRQPAVAARIATTKWGWMPAATHAVVHAVAVRVEIDAVDAASSIASVGEDLVEHIESWEARFIAWLWIITRGRGIWKQPSPAHIGARTTLWYESNASALPARNSLSGICSGFGIGGVGQAEIVAAITRAQLGPVDLLPHQFILAMHNAIAQGDHRRAILDAATAVETCLYPLLSARPPAGPRGPLEKLHKHRANLGDLLELARQAPYINEAIIPPDVFKTVRNDVAHRGRAPTWPETCAAERHARALVLGLAPI